MSTLIAGTYTGAATAIASAILSGYSPATANGSTVRSALFSNGEKGVWFDPSDFSTLFQDSAGTTPVTAVGQPVGLMLDKSQGLVLGPELVLNGGFDSGTNWSLSPGFSITGGKLVLTAATSGQAINSPENPAIAGSFYLVSFTIDSISGGSVRVEMGGNSDSITYSAAGVYKRIVKAADTRGPRIIWQSGTVTAQIDNFTCKLLPGYHATQATSTARPTLGRHPIVGVRNLLRGTDALATQSYTTAAVAYTLSFTGTGTITLSGAYVGSLVGTGASNRVSLTFTSTAASLTLTVSGSVTFAQLELGSAVTNYQSVVSQFDITEAGVNYAYYLYGDGVDNAMATPSIDFTATNKMSVFAGVRALTLTAVQNMLVESSVNAPSNAGSFNIQTPTNVGTVGNVYRASSSGSSFTSVDTSAINTPPKTSVISFTADIAAPSLIFSINGSTQGQSTATQGTGNYGNYPLYLMARGGTTSPFLGNLYGLVVRGALSDSNQIAAAEQWMNSKTGAY